MHTPRMKCVLATLAGAMVFLAGCPAVGPSVTNASPTPAASASASAAPATSSTPTVQTLDLRVEYNKSSMTLWVDSMKLTLPATGTITVTAIVPHVKPLVGSFPVDAWKSKPVFPITGELPEAVNDGDMAQVIIVEPGSGYKATGTFKMPPLPGTTTTTTPTGTMSVNLPIAASTISVPITVWATESLIVLVPQGTGSATMSIIVNTGASTTSFQPVPVAASTASGIVTLPVATTATSSAPSTATTPAPAATQAPGGIGL